MHRRFCPPGSVHSARYEAWLSRVIAADLEAAGFVRDDPPPIALEAAGDEAAAFDGPELTYLEVGRALGLSAERIRQIERAALDKIRRGFTPDLEPVRKLNRIRRV